MGRCQREENLCKHRPMDTLLSVVCTMDKAWSTLSEGQVLKMTIKDGRVGVRWDVDDWIQYIGDQRDVLEEMHFPRFGGDHPYVLIVRGDGFPCGARSWCQIACGFANDMQKARTLLYNWTLDVALVSEHETDLVRVLFGETLKKIQQIIDRGYMLLRGFWVRTVVIIGGDSPWLRHILCLSTFYEIGSIYSFATRSREKERWVGCEWRRSTRLEAKFLKYRKQGVSCVGAKGCIESPLLKVVPKSLFQSARKELWKEKGTSAKAEAPPAKAQVSATRSRKRKPKLAAVLPRKGRKSPRTAVRRTSQTPFLKSTNGSQPQSISKRRRRRR